MQQMRQCFIDNFFLIFCVLLLQLMILKNATLKMAIIIDDGHGVYWRSCKSKQFCLFVLEWGQLILNLFSAYNKVNLILCSSESMRASKLNHDIFIFFEVNQLECGRSMPLPIYLIYNVKKKTEKSWHRIRCQLTLVETNQNW